MKFSPLLALALLAAALPVAAQERSLLLGVFAGTLPCADCSGIRTELTLVRKGPYWAEGRYLLRQTYLGRSAQPFVKTGDWTTLRGDATNPDAVVYELDPDAKTPSWHFVKAGERAVRMLDADLKPLPKTLPTTLARQTKGLPGPKAVACLQHGGTPAPGGGCRK